MKYCFSQFTNEKIEPREGGREICPWATHAGIAKLGFGARQFHSRMYS
jgi:hypothetical protein